MRFVQHLLLPNDQKLVPYKKLYLFSFKFEGSVDVNVNGKQLCFIVLVRFDGDIKVLTLGRVYFKIMFVGFSYDRIVGSIIVVVLYVRRR